VLAVLVVLAAATVATAAPARRGATGCAPVSISAENARPGSTGWTPGPDGIAPSVSGYAGATSAVCGGQVTLHLGTLLRGMVKVRIQAWRLGYYGGAGGRLVWTSRTVLVRRPVHWSAVNPTTRMVSAPWPATFRFGISHSWPQGVYELRIVPLKATLRPAAIPLVVRDPGRTTGLVEVLSTNTWQMYNPWGGASAYSMPVASKVVSLDRPYSFFGLGTMMLDDVPLVRFAEQQNLDVSYITDPDLDIGVPAIRAARGLIFGSHTEYWTPGMRSALEGALAHGANAVFLGANSIYWHPVPIGRARPYRQLSIWKIAALDPHSDNPSLASEQWRDPPVSRPEQAILGEQFGCTNVLEPMTVPSSLGWVFQGSGATAGQSLQGVIYQETDNPDLSMPIAPGTRVVTETPFDCPHRGIGATGSAMTLAPNPGGGMVVDVGTRGWVCLLDLSCQTNPVYSAPSLLATDPAIVVGTVRNDPVVASVIRHVTLTLLTAAASGPGGGLVGTSGYPLADPGGVAPPG
jgi:hypothetical protein